MISIFEALVLSGVMCDALCCPRKRQVDPTGEVVNLRRVAVDFQLLRSSFAVLILKKRRGAAAKPGTGNASPRHECRVAHGAGLPLGLKASEA
jgi:hypothetical protein